MRGVLTAVVVFFLSLGFSLAQSDSDDGMLQIHEENGGSVAVRSASGFLNQDSSLQRKWYVINDANSPVRLERAGVFPRFDEKESLHYFVPVGTVSPKEVISAIEVRYVLTDIWGEKLRTYSVTRLVDSSTHVDLQASNKWPALESEASQLVAVFAFVSRVRTGDGQIWTFSADRIVHRMQALGSDVAPKDLQPDDPWVTNPEILYWLRAWAQKEADTKGTAVTRR